MGVDLEKLVCQLGLPGAEGEVFDFGVGLGLGISPDRRPGDGNCGEV